MNRRSVTSLALFTSAALFSACGDPPPLYGTSAPAQTAKTPGPTTPTLKDYPSGSTGNMPGDIIPNITAEGYRLSTKQNDSTLLKLETITLNDKDFHNSDKVKCMLVSYGATWCGACQQEQGALPGDVAADPSFGVLNILIEGPENGSNQVAKSDVDDWTQHFKQNYPVVYGGDSNGGSRNDLKALWNGYGSTIGLPFNIIVKVPSMTVVDVIQGFSPTLHDDAMGKCEAAP